MGDNVLVNFKIKREIKKWYLFSCVSPLRWNIFSHQREIKRIENHLIFQAKRGNSEDIVLYTIIKVSVIDILFGRIALAFYRIKEITFNVKCVNCLEIKWYTWICLLEAAY